MKNIHHILLVSGLLAACTPVKNRDAWSHQWTISAPAGDAYCRIDTAGESIIPNGRVVKPMGKTIRIAPHPYGLALSPDGSVAVTANSGNRPFSVTLVRQPFSEEPQIQQIPDGHDNDEHLLEDVFMGLAITRDNKHLWVAGGISNKVYLFDLKTGERLDSISCTSDEYPEGCLGDMALTRDESTLYICDQSNFRMIVADTRTRKVVRSVPVGRYPFGITLSPDEKTVYVANVGMFEYSYLKGKKGDDPNKAPVFPTSGFGSEEMKKGYETDDYEIPGLGNPNAPESFSVWAIDVSGPDPVVKHRIKTGFRVGEKIEGIPAVGGSGPNSIVAAPGKVFVTNGTNDCISVIDPERGRVVKQLFLKPLPWLSGKRGVIPFGITLSPDRQRLYVAASGINAVAVIDVPSLTVKGYLPVGWFPSKLAVSPDNRKLIVANAKGYGSGPNGGYTFRDGPEGSYVGHLMKGSVTILDIPADDQLPQYTETVIRQNFRVEPVKDTDACPVPPAPGLRPSPVRHIVFISKENRTYDEVFGQLTRGEGDPSLARYGYNRTFANQSGTDTVKNALVMPNHLALAQRFGISDNFYVDGDHSADGHRWLANTYPNEWTETEVASGYGGHRYGSKAKGRFAWTGGAGAIFPEDYNEAGSLWDHLERNKISFYNFGFGTEMGSNFTDSTMKYGGQRVLVNFPIPGPLYHHSSRQYPTYNMAIPDQYRADVFMQEFREKWLSGKEPMPQVITLMLPQDHGAGERPGAGYPYRESYMADNDLALGRVVEFLSQTPYWKEMAIVITEDDSQDGRDHVDAHRSVLMVCSPWAKKGHVSHVHASFGSIFKTFWNILGVPYLNQYDAAANDLGDLFTDRPDFTPYRALPADPRILDPQKLLTPFDTGFDWKSLLESPRLDNVEDFIREKRKKE